MDEQGKFIVRAWKQTFTSSRSVGAIMQAIRLIAISLLLGSTAARAEQSCVAPQPERLEPANAASPQMANEGARQKMLEARSALAAEAYDDRYYGDRFDAGGTGRDRALSDSAGEPFEPR
jgi:hypothetical protein